MPYQYWFIDFDDTLATWWGTWALENAFPRLIKQHQLTEDTEKLKQTMLEAQADSVSNPDAPFLLRGIFKTMGWPLDLVNPFLQEMQSGYQSTLFDDALPFLKRLQQHKKIVYILSNNPLSAQRAAHFGLLPYVAAVLTPDSLPDSPRKPDPKVWDALKMICPDVTKTSGVIVGDDPWSEGTFADACGMTCWIVDRHQRYVSLYDTHAYHWVESLLDISIVSDSSPG